MNITNKIITTRRLRYVASIALLFVGAFTITSCKKDRKELHKQMVVAVEDNIDEPITVWDLDVNGGLDTLYVFSASEINVQVEGIDGWLNIVGQQFIPNMGATRLVVESEAMEEDFLQRSGILNISNSDLYSRFFLKVTQGYRTRFADDFTWLRYGSANPLESATAVLYEGWNPTQIAMGWTTTADPQQDRAYVYGKNGYVQLGTADFGASLASPIIPEIQQDSILMLAFNAVSYVSPEGQRDQNKLTVSLIGGEFDDGTSQRVIELGHYDKSSPLINTKMWDNTLYNFVVHKPALSPHASTIQVIFNTGENATEPSNRLFIDNVRIYRVSQFEPEEAKR